MKEEPLISFGLLNPYVTSAIDSLAKHCLGACLGPYSDLISLHNLPHPSAASSLGKTYPRLCRTHRDCHMHFLFQVSMKKCIRDIHLASKPILSSSHSK